MAIGDAAGAKGLKVYTSADLVTLGYQQNNQRGDEIAAVMTRTDALEAVALNVPKCFVRKSTNGQNIAAEAWRQLTGGAWSNPTKSVGGFTFSGGVMTVPKAGVYQVTGHVMFRSDDFRTAAFNITRNSTTPDSAATICGNETTQTMPDAGDITQLGVSSTEFVALNAGDQLRFYVLQRNRGGDTRNIGDRPFDLSWNALWVDKL